MENRVRLAMEANRRYVQNGLDRRKLEGELDAFEVDMIQRCNENCEAAYWQSVARNDQENCKTRIAERAEKREKAKQTRKDITLACLIFFAFATVMFHLAAWTPLPWYASLILVGFGVLFLVSFIRDPRELPTD
jgi:hypothetical protein